MNWPRLLIGTLGLVAWGMCGAYADAQPNRSSDSGLQKWCADQAKRVFQQSSLGTREGDHYRSHYNTQVNKCFMAIETHRGKIITKTLLDAYALRTYASYFSMANASALEHCVLMPGASEEKKCNSDGEYEAFVARYMEQ
jgi:hypothetical protein